MKIFDVPVNNNVLTIYVAKIKILMTTPMLFIVHSVLWRWLLVSTCTKLDTRAAYWLFVESTRYRVLVVPISYIAYSCTMKTEGLIREDHGEHGTDRSSESSHGSRDNTEKVFRRLALVSRAVVVMVLAVSAASTAGLAFKIIAKDEKEDFSTSVGFSSYFACGR